MLPPSPTPSNLRPINLCYPRYRYPGMSWSYCIIDWLSFSRNDLKRLVVMFESPSWEKLIDYNELKIRVNLLLYCPPQYHQM